VSAHFLLVVVPGVVVLLRALGDIVDLGIVVCLVAPVFVVLIKTADRTLLDGASGTTISILARRFALVLRGRIRTEVAIPCRRWTAGAVRPWRPSAGARSKTSASAAWSSSPWPRREPAGPRGAGRTLFSRPSLADGERTALEGLLIESADRGLRDRTIGVIDKRKAARAARFAIDRENYLGGFTNAGKVLS
jgi:hypothetical protein